MGDCLSALWSARGEGGAAQQNLEQQRQLLGATWTPDSVAEATQQQLETTQRGMHAQKQLLLALRDQALSTEADGGLTEEQNDPAAADQQRFRLIMERNPIVRGQAEVIVKRYNALRELAVELLGIMSDQVAAEAGTQRTQLAQFSAVAAASTLQSALMVADDGTTLTGEAARRAVAAHLETAATERQHQSEVRQMVAVELDQRAREGNSAALTQPDMFTKRLGAVGVEDVMQLLSVSPADATQPQAAVLPAATTTTPLAPATRPAKPRVRAVEALMAR